MPLTEETVQPALSTFTVSVMAALSRNSWNEEVLEPDATDASKGIRPLL